MAATAVTFAEACAILHLAPHTLRKRIREGVIRAERVARPQGFSWVVFVDQVPADVTAAVTSNVTSEEPAHVTSHQTSEQPADNGQQLALALGPLIEIAVNAAVAPMRSELADVRATLSARDQEIGQLRAELEHMRTATSTERPLETLAAHVTFEPTQTTFEASQTPPWWQVWRRVPRPAG
jgi:hypothetical protein